MLTEKEKKIGIRMLIIGAVVLVGLIVFRIYENKANQGVRGSGVSDGTERATLLPVGIDTPDFYASALGNNGDCSLAQPAAYGVVSDLVRETNAAISAEEMIARQEEIDARDEMEKEPADLTEIASRSTSDTFASQSRYVGDVDIPKDDKSFTSNFVDLMDVVNGGELASWGVHYEYSNLDRTRGLLEGSRADNNSISRLYSEVIAPTYAEGSYCAFSVSSNGVTYLGGNESVCLLLDETKSVEDVASYVNAGDSFDSLLEKGVISLEYRLDDEGEPFVYDSAYDIFGISYDTYYVETLGATEQLTVVHVVGDTVFVEHYAVGGVTRTEYVSNPDKDEVGEDGTIVPGMDEIVENAFTGYYCW